MRRASLSLAFVVTATACGSPQPAPPTSAAHAPPTPVAAPTPAPDAIKYVEQPPLTGAVTLDDLREHRGVHAFMPVAVYVDNHGHRIGARLTHVPTGFTFDYLRIESAPQGFIWVNSFPTSDQGEPHTQEHLLLGKGDRGRKLGSFESMALAESSAFTAQWRTAYHFNTVAGHDEFWPEFDNELGALLYPDYTDEEIRREVRNFGVDGQSSALAAGRRGVVDKDSKTGALRLEEKGTVYNEMVRTYEDPDTNLWRAANLMVYGDHHPLAYDAGGFPAAIRTMTPADIRAFHDGAYRLGNMGMVAAFPAAMALGDVLDHTAAVLDQEAARAKPPTTPLAAITREAQLPAPAPAPAGEIRVVDYPYSDTTSPGPMMLAWPAARTLDPSEHELLELFVAQFAGDESTELYKELIDRKTRTLDLGASGVWGNVAWDQGNPVMLGLAGVKADKLDAASVDAFRALVLADLRRIASLPAGDPELRAIAQRIDSRIVDTRRRLVKFLDTPPRFGFRGTGSDWMDFLHHLEHTRGFSKSLTLDDTLARVEAIVNADGNPWTARFTAWGLLDAPYGVAARPSTAARAQIDHERTTRIADELARLQARYQTADAASTLAAYAKDYDAQTAAIDHAAAATPLPPLVAHPPMTLDDDLAVDTAPVGGVPAMRATFPSMATTRVTFAFRLDAVAEPDLMYLALLPSLLGDAGVIGPDGQPIAADVVRERQRKEILDLDVGFAHGLRTGRDELVVAGSGIDLDETRHALAWMKLVTATPDWRVQNLPRLRDLVEQAITSNRQRMLGAEEGWVADPRDAWTYQDSPVHLHSGSFLTRAHDLHRLRWMLEDPQDPKVTAAAVAALDKLAGAASLPRAQLLALAGRLAGDAKAGDPNAPPPAALAPYVAAVAAAPPAVQAIVREAGKDLVALVPDLPDGSLAADWRYLCREMGHDLRAGAPAALAGLERVRAAVVTAGNARLVSVGSATNLAAISAEVAGLIAGFGQAPRTRATYAAHAHPIEARLHEHDATATGAGPLYVGLVDPATSSGVFVDTVPMPGYTATTEAAVIDELAAGTYAGHGAHSLFMKTWGAGLAYSNGMRLHPSDDKLEYYAERCPLLPQTLRFVIDQLRAAKPDANIARYAVAKSFTSRVADGFEERAAAMAADLADGLTPDVVRAFRTKIVALAARADLATTLFARLAAVYGPVLPGYGPPTAAGTYFVIGPDAQLAAYQAYLHGAVGKAATLHRLYPRDFWVPAKL